MDLLNDYSSSDDEGGGASALKPPPREIKKAKPSPPPKATKQSRVLKLASVLPPEILERLARDDDESSSDDDDQAVKEKQGSGTASLLSNLKTIKPKNASLFPVAAFTAPGSAAKATSISKPTKPPSDMKLQTPSLPVPKPSIGKPRSVQAAPMAYAQRNNSLPSSSPSIAPPSTPSTNSTTPSLNPRKRRQQIERALRNGDVSAVTPTLQAGTIMGDSSAVRVVDYEAAQTIRQVPTGVYDPATGKLSDAGKRGAGKNQVHFLVHQAQALERQRAEQVGSSNGNRRADAKRKYGW